MKSFDKKYEFMEWVPVSSIKVSCGRIKDMRFDIYIHQKSIDILIWKYRAIVKNGRNRMKLSSMQKQHTSPWNFRLCLVTVFFLSFSVFKTIFCFLRQKTCLVTVFRQKSKTIFNFHIVKETENRSRAVFIFQFSLTLENTLKHADT